MKKKSILPLFIALFVAACALTPAQQTQLNGVIAAVTPIVQTYASGGKVSYAQAIPVALNSLAVFEPSQAVNLQNLSVTIQKAVSDFTNGTGGNTGQKIAKVILDALPSNPTGAQVNTALSSAGIGASNGANSPP